MRFYFAIELLCLNKFFNLDAINSEQYDDYEYYLRSGIIFNLTFQ
jgi:hypothetical protein